MGRPSKTYRGQQEATGTVQWGTRVYNIQISSRQYHLHGSTSITYRGFNIFRCLPSWNGWRYTMSSRSRNHSRAVDESVAVIAERTQFDHGCAEGSRHQVGVRSELLPATRSTNVNEDVSILDNNRSTDRTYRGSRAMAKSDCMRNSPGRGERTSAAPVVLPGLRTPLSKTSTKNWESKTSGVESRGEPYRNCVSSEPDRGLDTMLKKSDSRQSLC